MKKMFNERNQIHNFISSSGSGTVINYGSGSVFLSSYGSGYGSGSTSQKVTVPTVPVPVPVPQHWSHEIDFKSFDKNLRHLAKLRDAACF
jgi:hypothetical protein